MGFRTTIFPNQVGAVHSGKKLSALFPGLGRNGIGMNVVTQFPAARDYERDLRFRAMFEGAAIGIGICQLDGRILEENPALSRMLGYSREELAGTNARELYPERRREVSREIGSEISDDNFPPDERLLADLLRGKRDSFEIEKRYRHKDGSELWGHFTLSCGGDH